MSNVELRKQLNQEWKTIVKNHDHGPAPFYDPDDYGDETYVRVTREEALAGRPCRIYADGIYDVFHSGHARQLMQAKNFFPNCTLMVGASNDELTHKMKGKTVCTDEERYEALRHCKYVDLIIPDAPWSYSKDFFNKYKIDFIAHDDAPYTIGGSEDTYALPKSLNMFCVTNRTEGISTSDMITRIVKNYDSYIRRNLSRGYDRKELNVGPIHATRLRTETALKKTVDSSKHLVEDTYNWTKEMLGSWKDNQVNHIRSFLHMYAPYTPEIVNKGLDAISPPASPHRKHSIDNQDSSVNPDQLASALRS